MRTGKLLSFTLYALVCFGCAMEGRSQTNGNEYTLASPVSVSYTGTTRSNPSGNRLLLIGESTGSRARTNSEGFRMSIGGALFSRGAVPTPTPTATQTSTPTPTRTPTNTPTPTPTGPTPTRTPCTVAGDLGSFDLIEDQRIDSRDLIEWLHQRKAGAGSDFNCDGDLNHEDLILFSIHWHDETESTSRFIPIPTQAK